MRRFFYRRWAAGLIFAVFCLAIVAFFWATRKKERAPQPQARENFAAARRRGTGAAGEARLEAGLSEEATGLAAEKLARRSWAALDRQRQSDGFYRFYLHGAGKRVVRQANIWTVRGRLGFYRHFSHRSADLRRAQEDAQALADYCRTEKEKCILTVTPFAELFAATKQAAYRDYLQEVGAVLRGRVFDEETVMTVAAQARELARLYLVLHDPRDLILAKDRLVRAGVLLAKGQRDRAGKTAPQIDPQICYLALAQTEVGKAAAEKELLARAAELLRRKGTVDRGRELTLILPCVESAFELGEWLGDQRMEALGEEILAGLVADRWDGEGGFFLAAGGSGTANVADAGYLLYLLGFRPEKLYKLTQ